jgi:hypothetical protein
LIRAGVAHFALLFCANDLLRRNEAFSAKNSIPRYSL